MPFLKKRGQVGFRNWNTVSYLLASFVVLTIATNLYFSHAVLSVYESSVKANAEWTKELKQLTKLEALAARVSAPGHHIFRTEQPESAREARNAALAEFFEFMKGLEDRSSVLKDRDRRSQYHAKLKLTNERINQMVNAEDRIFQYFALGRKDAAARHMVEMHNRSAAVTAAIAELMHVFQDYMVEDLEAQVAGNEDFATYAKLLGATIVILMLCVVWYGRKVSNLMQVHDRELTLKSELLSTTLENMAQGIVVLDADHKLVAANSQ